MVRAHLILDSFLFSKTSFKVYFIDYAITVVLFFLPLLPSTQYPLYSQQ